MSSVPTATVISTSSARITWRVQFPSSPKHQGATYRAYSYPHSDTINVETWEHRRPVSALVARNRMPLIKAAIADALEKASKP